MMSRALSALVVCFAISAAAGLGQIPNLGESRALPGSLTVGPATGSGAEASVATAAGISLLVFSDGRAGTRDIFARRLDGIGAPEPLPFVLNAAPGDQVKPRVVSNGTTFLVAWLSQEPTSGYYENRLRAVRVAPSGQVLDAVPLELPGETVQFALGSDGTDFLIVKAGSTAGAALGLVGFRISAGGAVLNPSGTVVQPQGQGVFYNFDVAFAAGNYLLVWGEWQSATGWDVLGRRVSPTLSPVDAAPVGLVVSALTESQPRVASDGSTFLLTYWHDDTYWSQGVLGRRFGGNLVPLDAQPIPISGGAQGYGPTPVPAHDGSQWYCAWVSGTATKVARIGSNGTVLDPGGVVVSAAGTQGQVNVQPAVAAIAGGGVVAAWTDQRWFGGSVVIAARLAASGTVSTETIVSTGVLAHAGLRLAADGEGFLAVARAHSAAESRILAWRLDALGAARDVAPIEVAAGAGVYGSPAVAWNGGVFLVTWSEGSVSPIQVRGRRLDREGVPLDAAPFAILPGNSADVAALNGDFLVVSAYHPTYPQSQSTYGARVRGSDGAVLDTVPRLIAGPYSVHPRVTSDGQRWLVLTEGHWSHNQTSSSIFLTPVSAGGVVGAGFGAVLSVVTDWGSSDCAASPAGAAIAYQNGSNQLNTDLFVQRFDPSGALLGGPTNLGANAAGGQVRPAIAFDGVDYVVAYESYQENAQFYDLRGDVYVRRIALDGTLREPAGVSTWSDPVLAASADVAGLGGGRSLLGATVFDPSAVAMRGRARPVRPDTVLNFGVSTPGCRGAHRIDVLSAPRLGNLGFGFVVDRGPPLSTGVLAMSNTRVPGGADPFGLGITLYLGLVPPASTLFLEMPTDGNGLGTTPIPIASNPSLVNLQVFAQAAFLWSASCTPTLSAFSASDALELRLQ